VLAAPILRPGFAKPPLHERPCFNHDHQEAFMTKSLILTALLAGALAAPAHAQDLSVSVGYGDLDLSGDTGVARLDRRIDAAIDTVCGNTMGQQPLSRVMAIRKCTKETRADVSGPRQIAIAKARGQVPSVELASAGSAGKLVVRRR
jgi:UrcA family protein